MDEEEIFDDACDLGQFFVNPCYFMFVQLQKVFCTKQEKNGGVPDHKEDDGGGDAYQHYDQHGRATKRKKSAGGLLLLTPRMQQAIYIVGVYGCWIVIFLRFYPLQAIHKDRIPDVHRTLGYVAFSSCLITWIIASFIAKPGDINHETLAKYDNYPYDNVLYFDDCICPTLHIRKLARSKFDRYTKRQVPRFDHFCGWLNVSIGEDNYRHFFAFLTVHTIACVYGSIMTGWIFWNSCGTNDERGQEYYHPLLSIVVWLLYTVAMLLVAFWGFHLRNIARGMTTNEYYMWESIKDKQEKQQGSTKTATKMPRNIYNLGILLNFQKMLFPRSSAARKKRA